LPPEKTGGVQVSRGPRGQFAVGRSGNPAGRPRGSRNRATVLAQSLLDGDAEAIVRRAVKLAREGDPVALRLCLERIVPRRERSLSIDMPRIERAHDLVAAVGDVIAAVAAGELTLPEGREFLALLESQRKAIETADLAVRIEALESAERKGKRS
jgi:hypothetical protein